MSGLAREPWRAVLAAAVVATALVVGIYLALGGATYKPLEVQDPCDPRPDAELEERTLLERLALSALDGAACELRVPREDLALAIADEDARADFAERFNVSDEAIENAAEAGLMRAIDDAEAEGAISSFEAGLLRTAAGQLPVGTVIDLLQTSAGRSVLDLVQDLLG